jgi:hypothetical protein
MLERGTEPLPSEVKIASHLLGRHSKFVCNLRRRVIHEAVAVS